MNQVTADIWPTLFATFLSALAMYIGFINKMRSQIAVLESKVKDLEEECEKATAKMNELEHANGILEAARSIGIPSERVLARPNSLLSFC